MAGLTYMTKIIVLRKTKLGESDLILSMLTEDGSQIRAVAKGARKPQNSFSARLDLYCIAEVLNAYGKNLDIVKEAKLIEGNEALRGDIERTCAAACLAELIERVSQTGLPVPRFFDFTCAALDTLKRSRLDQIPLLTASCLLKVFAFAGLRPCLNTCVICGCDIPFNEDSISLNFSFDDGGVLCDACATQTETYLLPKETIVIANNLLNATFEEIFNMVVSRQTELDILRFCQSWTKIHIGFSIKSLQFFLTSSLF